MQIPQNIIEHCRQKNRLAQQQLHQLSYSNLMAVGMRYVTSKDEAEHVVNEAYFKIFTKIDTYSYSQNFEAWMRTIVINTALDYVKSEKKHQYQADITTLIKEPTQSVSQSLHEKDLLNILQSIPIQQQAVFNLYAIEGYSHKEIAKQLNISETNSKYILHQARKTLQEKVNNFY